MAVYVETSAALKLFNAEPETPALTAYLRTAGSLATSIVTRIEMTRAVRRAGLADGAQHVTAWLRSIQLVLLTHDVAQHAAQLEPATLRSLDAVHLASALKLQPSVVAMVTYDVRLIAAAALAGLPTASPR